MLEWLSRRRAPVADLVASVTFLAILITIVIEAPTSRWLRESDERAFHDRFDKPNTNLGEGRQGLSV